MALVLSAKKVVKTKNKKQKTEVIGENISIKMCKSITRLLATKAEPHQWLLQSEPRIKWWLQLRMNTSPCKK